MIIETERLILRPWREDDAKDLYELAKDERIGPVAGWPPHVDEENSRQVIIQILSKPGCFAITLKGDDTPIGAIEISNNSDLDLSEDEAELGYWIGYPYWGKCYMTEAAKTLISVGFEALGYKNIWCGYYEGNERSRRVQEKCGFIHQYTNEKFYAKLLDEYRILHVSKLERPKDET